MILIITQCFLIFSSAENDVRPIPTGTIAYIIILACLLLDTRTPVLALPSGSESCPLPTETVKLKESDYPTCGGVTPTLKWSVLVLMEFILTLVCRF